MLDSDYNIGLFSELNRHGFSVFPVSRGKKTPNLKWARFQTEVASLDEIAAWDRTDLNVGVTCGPLSNLVVLDVDGDEGQDFLDSLSLPRTPVVNTGRGKHYYFRYPALGLRNGVKIQGVPLDIRAEGGYVVGAGSLHPDGHHYRWEISPDECDIAALPEEALARLQARPLPSSGNEQFALATKSRDGSSFLEAGPFSVFVNQELQLALDELRSKKEGERNNTLNLVAYRLAGHVGALNLSWSLFAEPLTNAALEIGLSPDEISRTLASAYSSGCGNPTKWIVEARRWVYIGNRDRFLLKADHSLVAPPAFDRMFNSIRPYEKGGFAAFLLNGDLIEKALNVRFDPFEPEGVFSDDGTPCFNSYRTPDIVSVEGDATPFREFLEYLVPDPIERGHLTRMMAWTVMNPGQKLSHALLLTSTIQGIGKTTLIEIWRDQLGKSNTRKTTSDEMESGFQEYLGDTIMVFVEELNFGQGLSSYNKIKDQITGETAVVNRKFIATTEQRNFANFVLLSNMDVPIQIEATDRRFFVVRSPAARRDGSYWKLFYGWLSQNQGVIRSYLESIDLSDFNPKDAPPVTQAKLDLIESSSDPLSQDLAAMIRDRVWPFSRDVFTVSELQQALPHVHFKVKLTKLMTALRSLGCEPLGQHRTTGAWSSYPGMARRFVEQQGSRASLWACANIGYWTASDGGEIAAEYEREKGSLAPFDGVPTSGRVMPIAHFTRGGGLLPN